MVRAAAPTLGVKLGRLAVQKDVSVQDIATRTGASRTTVYSWFSGRGVTNAYQKTVTELIAALKKIETPNK